MLDGLQRYADSIGVVLTDDQVEMMRTYWQAVVVTNRHTNLTRITDDREATLKHFVDSLTLLGTGAFQPGARVVDVGSGAGFPGVPLKIARPDIRVTFIDATLKRVRFLQSVIKMLHWSDAEVFHGRVEELGRRPPLVGTFDVAVARAVAKLEVLVGWCLPLVRPGGYFIAMKGPRVDQELRAARQAMASTGAELVRVHTLALPEGAGDRTIIVVRQRAGEDR